MDRRVFLTHSAACALAGALPLRAAAQESVPGAAREIRVIAAGGGSGQSVQKGYIDPFTTKTGIKVIREDTSGTPLGRLRAMVESGRIDAVLHEIGGAALAQAQALNLVQPLNWDAIRPGPMFPEARHTHGLGYQYFSVVTAWRRDAKPLTNWRDFWNVQAFPGKRSLPDLPYYSLPIALLADGVAPPSLYPIDLDRAFASLARIKGSVSVWWASGAQAPQLMSDNEVQYAAVYSGRVAGNDKFGFSFNQGNLGIGYFVIPQGAAEDQRLAAYRLLREFTLPDNQAEAAKVISYTGNSPELDKLLPQDKLSLFPTTQENRARQILPNDAFWFQNAAVVEKRWQQFKLSL
jgi:putative spermidine/putrescine transport system substrate-binding protein